MTQSNFALCLAGILALLLGSSGRAQEWRAADSPVIAAAPQAPPKGEAWVPEFLHRLPHPPDEMRSLHQQAPSASPYECSPTVRRYFETDPLLDPPDLAGPGWFYSLEFEVVGPQIFKSVGNTVTAGSHGPDRVELPNRGLDWTVAPRLELGYRLPAGFGGFGLSYRFMGTSGDQQISGPDGPANLHSRMDLNVLDFDYQSAEYTPSDRWTMRWRIGPRLAWLYYDSVLNENVNAATNGSGILQQHATNKYVGIGPHASVELIRQLDVPGLSAIGRFDFGSLFGRIKQGTFETALDPASSTGISAGASPLSSSQTVPVASILLGLNWRSPTRNGIDCFVGYQYEYWWNVGRLSLLPASRGELSIHGIVGRVQINY